MKKLIELKNIKKSYGENVILEDLNLYINENEFITLLGPSGCGKTTTLRLIGGFEEPDTGEIILDGIKINDLPAYQRPINTVFQRYALFPHLNVYDNIAFGLRNFNRSVSDIKTNVKRKYEATLKDLELTLNKKTTSDEEKTEIKNKIKEIKQKIKDEVIEEKDKQIEARLEAINQKYDSIIEEFTKDMPEEVKKEMLEAIDFNQHSISKILSDYDLYNEELVKKYKRILKDKKSEIRAAKHLSMNKKQIDEAVKAALKLVKLEGYENRHIDKMSGGQQQRIAIARAIVNKPKILLLDEPLAALDLKLRQAMQYELKEMQKSLGITFIFVTHDQEEALTMSDTIVVMDKGKILQIGTPEDIYNEPKNRFVAKFIGESNIFEGKYLGNRMVSFLDKEFECVDENFYVGEECDVVIRPEDFDIVDLEEAKIIGEVTNVIFKGIHFEITARVGDLEIMIRKYEIIHVGEKIGLSVDPFEIHLMKKNEQI